MAVNQKQKEILPLPGKKKKRTVRGRNEIADVQFIFISMAFHYGVKMNGYKTTGNTEVVRKRLCSIMDKPHTHILSTVMFEKYLISQQTFLFKANRR